MKIAVTGASGLIGSTLVPALRADGHDVIRLVRRTPRTADEHRWDPQHRRIDPALLADVDAVVNLAGTPIRPRPWTRGYKDSLLRSRLDSTATISEALATAAATDPDRHRVLLSASAVGYYGDTGQRPVTEDGPGGHRLPGPALRAVGGGDRPGDGRGRPGGPAADRAGDRPRRRCSCRSSGWSSGSVSGAGWVRAGSTGRGSACATTSPRSASCSRPTTSPGRST